MTKRRLLPVVIAALAAIAVVVLVPLRGGDSTRATVVRAVDGDTLRVSVEGRERSVRLLGIDTPETHRPGTPVECGGPQASALMAALAVPGTHVTLEHDPGQDRVDRYGRVLAYVRLADGRLLEDEQLRAGWAMAYVYASRPVSLIGRFRAAEAGARAAGRGVWRRCGGRFHAAGSR